MNREISRRDALKLALNMGVASFAGGALLGARSVFAQQVTAVLGHFGSANPQTLGKASGSFAKAFGPNVKTEFATVGGGRLVRRHDRKDLRHSLARLEDLGESRPLLADRGDHRLMRPLDHLGREPQRGNMGDHVIVINAEKVRMTGKKWTDRVVFKYSGYPGGQKAVGVPQGMR